MGPVKKHRPATMQGECMEAVINNGTGNYDPVNQNASEGTIPQKIERGKYMLKKVIETIRKIPHLFAKLMVIWCVICGTAASAWSLRILSHTGHDPAALLGVILAFFGGELLLMCLKTVLGEKKKPPDQSGG